MLAFILVIAQLQAPEFRPGQPLPESPDDHAYAAAQFLKRAMEQEQKGPNHGTGTLHASSLRFLSLYSVPQKSVRRKLGSKAGSTETEAYSPLDDTVQVLVYAINQTNRVNPPVTLIKVKPDLFAVYLDGPGWSTEAWDQLAAKDPYFKQEWIAESTWSFLTSYLYTPYPMMRADQFITVSTTAPDYYRLLGLPETEKEFFALLGIQEKLLTDAYRIKAGVKTDGLTVTLNNRILERRQGAFDVWSSNDVVNSKAKKNALRQLDVVGGDIHRLDIDGQEHVFELGWGGWGGFLNDAKGKRVDEVPIAIANDDNYRDRRVIAGRSCLTCHDLGIKSFASDQAKLLENQVITLRTVNPQDAIALSGRYDEKAVQRNIRTDQENYRSSIEDLVGTSPEKIAASYANIWRGYSEARVTLHQAALEAGLPDDGLVAVITPSIDPNLLYLIQAPGRSISRDVLEDTFNQIMLLKGKPVQPKDRQPMPAPGANVKAESLTWKWKIDGFLVLKTPAQIGEQQTAKVTLKTPKPSVIKAYATAGGTKMRASAEPTTEHELDFTFTSGPEGFPKSVEVTLDTGPVTIQVESKP